MDVTELFKKKGVLVAKEALDYINSQPDPESYARQVLERNEGKKIITINDVKISVGKEDLVEKNEKDEVEVFFPSDFKPVAKDVESDLRIFEEYDITGDSDSSGEVEDFIDYFRDRYDRLAKILKERGVPTRSIESVKKIGYQDTVRIIGMVVEKRVSRAGHILVVLDDPTDEITVLVPKDNRELLAKATALLPDEVVAVDGRLSNTDLFIASDIIQPDIIPKKPATAKEDIALAMLSDLHVGSNLFLERLFLKFIDWLKGKGPRKDLAGRVKYITIAGDLVDGVGIYPGQEDELEILDIYDQYAKFEALIEEIPEYIEVVIIPGNHDAVRVADPQPAIPKDLLPELYELSNVHLVGSPAYFSIHGVEVLMYHGHSIHSYVPHISGFTYTQPERFGIEALKRRHLHVVYGERPPITPEKRDYMVIDRVPDIMHFGDVHRNGYANYKGVTIVNSGAWQDITPYQIKQGHHPTPGILPVITLMDRRLSILKFKRGETSAPSVS